MHLINKILKKKVLFIDLETTGLPNRNKNNDIPGSYPDYTSNKDYDRSRILQIGWCYYDNFSLDFVVDLNDVHSILVKPVDFTSVRECIVQVHGITFDNVKKNGFPIEKILNSDFGKCLTNCEYIVAFNAYFDFSILMNELHRAKNNVLYNKLFQMRNDYVICAMDLSKSYLGIGRAFSQSTTYHILLNKEAEKQHDAKGDVFAMLEIVKYILINPDKKVIIDDKFLISNNTQAQKANRGNLWDKNEEIQLEKLYLTDNKTICEIALIHKRSIGGIRARLTKLNILKECDKTQLTFGKIVPIATNLPVVVDQTKTPLIVSKSKKAPKYVVSHYLVMVSPAPTKIMNNKQYQLYSHDQQTAMLRRIENLLRKNNQSIELKDIEFRIDDQSKQICFYGLYKITFDFIEVIESYFDRICGDLDSNNKLMHFSCQLIHDEQNWLDYIV